MTRAALVLAGGGSRRLGRDKAWVEVGGRTVLGRILGAIGAVDLGPEPDIVISVREAEPFRARIDADLEEDVPRTRLVADDSPGLGPVAGLAAGLRAIRSDLVVVVAADLPFVGPGLFEALLDEMESSPEAEAVIPVVGGRDQSLCAAYRVGPAADAADAVLEAAREPGAGGGPSVADLVDRLTVRRLTAFGAYGPEELAVSCRGIDTPDDLDWARGRSA